MKQIAKIVGLVILTLLINLGAIKAQSFGYSLFPCDSSNYSYSFIQTGANTFYSVGVSATQNGVLVKYDSLMNKVWIQEYGGSYPDFLRGIKQYTADKLLVFGYTESNDWDLSNNQWQAGALSVWIAIIDTNGNYLHHNTIGVGWSTGVHDITFTPDGTIYVVGTTMAPIGDFVGLNTGALSSNAYIFKFDSALNKLKLRCFQGGSDDYPITVTTISNKKLLISVGTESDNGDYMVNTPTPEGDNVLFCIDDSLNNIWVKRYGSFNNHPTCILYDSITSVIYNIGFTGEKKYDFADTNYSYLNEGGDVHTYVMKLDTLGNLLWSRIYGGFTKDPKFKKPNCGSYNGVIVKDGLYILNEVTGQDNRDLGTDSGGLWLIKLDTGKGTLLKKYRFTNKLCNSLGRYNPLFYSPYNNAFYVNIWAWGDIYEPNPLVCIYTKMSSSASPYYGYFKAILTEWPTAINEPIKEAKKVKIYPNPAQAQVIVEVEHNMLPCSLYIYSMDAKLLSTKPLVNGNNTIDVSSLPKGNYIFSIIGENINTSSTISIRE
jgi:hypothetical protein